VEKSLSTKHPQAGSIITAAALVAANFFYGTNVIAVKQIAPHHIQALGISFSRIFFTAILLTMFPLFNGKKERIEKKDYLLLMVAGLLGVTLNQTFSIMGIASTNPIHSSLLIMSTPIIVSVLAAIFLKESFGGNKIIGLLLGLTGAFILIKSRATSGEVHPPTMLGDVLILAGSVCYSTYLILIRKVSKKYSPITILRFVFLFGALFSLPFSLQSFATAEWSAFSGWDWFSILYIVVLGTLAANLLMNWGVQQWGPSKTGSVVYFQPVFGTLGAVLLMGEQFSIGKAIAGLLIVAGVWITSMKLKKKESVKE
jgi:drug/metabolite transporter (DMT)-like permease